MRSFGQTTPDSAINLSPRYFSQLEPVHCVAGRTRFHFRRERGSPFNGKQIVRAVENLAGVLDVRVNPAARSLAYAAAGRKRLHILAGGVFLAALAVHLGVHRKRLLK